MKGVPGASSKTQYYSSVRTLSYSEGQLLRDRTEDVEFVVQTDVKSVDAKRGAVTSVAKTIAKDGKQSLHLLAFPERDESIEYIVTSLGEVLQAGAYSPHSLFFVPSLPIPKENVRVGDTWELTHSWLSGSEKIPLKLEVIGILKALIPCEKRSLCADIEVSGRVALGVAPTAVGAQFDSRIWGRILFSLDRGDVIRSEVRSREEMTIKAERTVSISCMKSELMGEGKPVKFACKPLAEPVASH